ncbi:flagellar hook-length control protein FliK [Shewanella sp. C32]|uniref:Flagellar hook-length control protein FliK n=1 Tax=Shewanella electrica TaxID=515560 RepID=A0ABT2FKE3_9GAMM|nr:flagellar hook-length control protein FliK [Shewanella electrica]MCH1924575.1 flagellar hook-length control protein FliK [Shewanella electrica]MCS4556476.1 flagellar hook-length control protein FliK [Shewanella electrica]
MQQLASSVLLNHDNANTRTRSERGSILDPSQGSDLGKINSSFKDLYGQVHQQLNQAKQAYHRAETQQVASQNAAQAESAPQPDTVDSTLAQIAAGKNLPSDAAEGDATLAQQLASLSDDEQQQVKQLLAQLLNKLKGDSTEQPDATDTSEQSIGDMLQALLNSATDSSDTELDDDSIAGLQDVLKRLADGDEVSDDELRDALSMVSDLTSGEGDQTEAMQLLAALLGQVQQQQSANKADATVEPSLNIVSLDAKNANAGQQTATDKLSSQSAALNNADDNALNGSKTLADAADKATSVGMSHDKSVAVVRDMAAGDNNTLKDISALGATSANANTQQTSSANNVQLSLRLANEQQVQQQELVQRFAPVMRQQLLTMVKDGIQHAEIRLDPPELGSMTVKLQVRGDHTQVQFHVTQTQAKDLIEQAMPRLKDLLQQQGMNLADSQVSYGGGSQQQAQGEAQAENGAGFAVGGDNSAETSTEITQQPLNRSDSYASGIDYYA